MLAQMARDNLMTADQFFLLCVIIDQCGQSEIKMIISRTI